MLILWVLFGMLSVAALFDIAHREIPHTVTTVVFLYGVAATILGWNGITWTSSVAGVFIGFGLSLAMYALGGLAGGDVKLLAAMGAVLGWRAELGVLFYVAIFGGLLALVARWRKETEYAYCPAIALGMLAYILRGYLPIGNELR
jgi:prepilin peptidase CpaA